MCRSCSIPPAPNTGRWFDIVVTVNDVPSTYTSGQWTYDPPAIISVTPTTVSPQPPVGMYMFIFGVNFGPVAGSVTVAGRLVVCTTWSNTRIVCFPPVGVVSAAVVVVTAVSTLQSPAMADLGANVVHYLAPSVVTVSPSSSETQGGGNLTVHCNSVTSSLPVSVWLSRGGAAPEPPWEPAMFGGSSFLRRDVLRCQNEQLESSPLVANVSETVVVCIIPPGTGDGWAIVVVNHDFADDGTTWSPTMLQFSSLIGGMVVETRSTVDLPVIIVNVCVCLECRTKICISSTTGTVNYDDWRQTGCRII